MFNSIYSDQLSQYYNLRCSVLSESARKHELCYLKRFDSYIEKHADLCEPFTENFINGWISTLSGKSSSIENEVIVIRQFLNHLRLSGENVYLPVIPKVREDYVPYIFSDDELECIFDSADNVIQKDHKADPYLVLEFPVIIRLLYSCGLRIGETVRISMTDVDLAQLYEYSHNCVKPISNPSPQRGEPGCLQILQRAQRPMLYYIR